MPFVITYALVTQMLKFIFNKSFLTHVAIAIAVVLLGVWILLKFIDGYTNNGQTITVPSLSGLTPSEIEVVLKDKNLRFEIIDSVYAEKAEKGVVLDQFPAADDMVKENRTIYVTVSKVIPPKIAIPDVVDMSQRLAIAKLQSYGLKIGRLDYTPSECLNCVVKLNIRGKEVRPNDLVSKGSVINLTLGSGTSDEKVLVPYLVNLSKQEAQSKLQESFLNMGAEIYEDCKTTSDSLSAKIYKQSQTANSAINMGYSIDVWFTCDPSKINYNPPADTLNSNP